MCLPNADAWTGSSVRQSSEEMHIVDLENRVNLKQTVSLSLKFKKLLYQRPGFVLSLQNAIFWVSMLDSGIVVCCARPLLQRHVLKLILLTALLFNICCISYSSCFSLIQLFNSAEKGKEVIWNKANSSLSKNGSCRNERIRMASCPIWSNFNTLCTVNSCYNEEDLRQDHLMLGVMFSTNLWVPNFKLFISPLLSLCSM